MKLYKRMKGFGKSLGIGLAGAAFYAASLAMPVHAEAKQEQVVPQTRLEQVITVKQAETLYQERLNEYSADKKLDSGEIGQLHGILVREKELLDGKKPVIEKYFSTKKDLSVFPEKISKLEERLEHLGKSDNTFLGYLSEKKERIEDLLNEEYPGLLNKKDAQLNIVYSSDMEITDSELKYLIEETAKTLHSKLSLVYDDNVLKKVSETSIGSLDLKDVAKLLEVMQSFMLKLEGPNHIGITKEMLEKQIEDLTLQEKDLWQGVINVQEKEKVEGYIKTLSDIDRRLNMFSDYISFEGKVKDFVERFGDRNEYWSDSAFGITILKEKEGYKASANFLNNSKGTVEDRLNHYLESKGLDAKVKDLKNPVNPKFHVMWCLLVHGFFIPIVRNLLVRKYVGARDEDDYLIAAAAGLGSGALGTIFTDGLHPLAFWMRMGTPLVIQPLRKILKK